MFNSLTFRLKFNKYREKFMHGLFFVTAMTSIAAVLLICFFLFRSGFPAMAKIGFFNFLFGKTWSPPSQFGIFPMIIGSLYVTAGAIVIGVPIGLLTAVFMAKFCPKRIYPILKPVLELLAGIPSIVYGLFGLGVVVPLVASVFDISSGKTILTASILLGVMILPTIINISEAALRAVPENYYEGALALGATHERAVFKVMLPAAKSGVFASVVLGIGRAIGETMAVIMVIGNQARFTTDILKGIRTMTTNIVMDMGYAGEGLHKDALIATGVVLFIFILILNLSLSILQNRQRG